MTIGTTGFSGDAKITTAGTAQFLFGNNVPPNGFRISNPHATQELWISDSTIAAPNAQGCERLAPNGGWYETPPGYKPVGSVSVYSVLVNHPITARGW